MKLRFCIVMCLLGLAVFGGCTKTRPLAKPGPSPRVSEKAKKPLPRLKALPVEQLETAKKEPEARFSITMHDTDIRGFLAALAKQTGLNIVPSPEVKGKVSLHLKKVTLEEALDAVLTPLGYDWRREDRFVFVSEPKLETRVFRVNYVSTTRTGTSTLTTAGAKGVGAGLGGSSSTLSSRDTADFFTELKEGIGSVLSKQGKVSISPLTGMITVTDLPPNLEKVADYLEAFQAIAHRQVLIQATIVEVTLSKGFQYGIDWSLLGSAALLGVKGAATGGAVLSQRLGTGNTMFQFGVSGSDIHAVLDAMSRQGEVRVRSNPKVSTLNNQKAMIRVGTQDIFFEITTQRQGSKAGAEEVVAATPRVIPVGITLDVTPQIGQDGTITMNIHPTITERTGEARSRFGDVVPILGVRETQTVIRVRSGETIIIGGLIGSRNTRETSSVPMLKDIPLLGALFRSPKESNSRTELVILLTPRIMGSGRIEEITNQEVERAKLIKETPTPLERKGR